MQPFVAIDFETANNARGSACAVGAVRFDAAGLPGRRVVSLLRPHPSVANFLPINISIHGIHPSQVVNAPEWDVVFAQVAELAEDLPLVAHNMSFDSAVLDRLAELYGAALPNSRLCTLRLARRLLRGVLRSNSLPFVFDHFFPGEELIHHEAEADALAAGRIFARFQAEYGVAAAFS